MRYSQPQQGNSTRRGFSLLEVLLTMMMAVVLMGLINWAFDFYTRDMNSSNAEIKQTQVAAAVLQMIENDLRATLHPEEVDMSALEEAFESIAGNSGQNGGGNTGAGQANLSAAGITSTDPALEEETEPVDLTAGVAVLQTPGLIGNQTQIQIDVSRLPRLEEYMPMMDAENTDLDDVPSDIKTVAYFVQAQGAGGVQDPLNSLDPESMSEATNGGLVRRSLDRSVTKFAVENGNLAQLNQTGELLAPEVSAIEFQYWDGITWMLEWNSDELEELPLAIRVDVHMVNPNAPESGVSSIDAAATRIFSHIIRLQMAKPIEEEEETDMVTGTETPA